MSLDRVHIEGLRTRAVIGCYGWERLVKQPLIFDIELSGDFSRAASTDDVTHALDYAAISLSVETFVEASSFQLLEALIDSAGQLLNIAAVEKVNLRIRKPYAVADASVGISIERTG